MLKPSRSPISFHSDHPACCVLIASPHFCVNRSGGKLPSMDLSVSIRTLEWLWNQVQESAIAMWQWECNQVNQQSGSTWKNKAHWCLPLFHKRSSTKRGYFNWEYRHRRSTCRYIHQAIGWEKVLQAKEWVEHIGFLKYVLMPPPTYMTCLSFEQSKVKVDWHGIHPC